MSTEEPRIPEVGDYVKGHGKLISLHDVTPPVQKITAYLFESHDATVVLRVNGIDVKHFVTLHSLWGIESCLENAVEEAESYAKKYYGEGIEIVVLHNISHVLGEIDRFKQNYHDRRFHGFTASDHSYEIRDQIPEDRTEEYWSSTRGFLTNA